MAHGRCEVGVHPSNIKYSISLSTSHRRRQNSRRAAIRGDFVFDVAQGTRTGGAGGSEGPSCADKAGACPGEEPSPQGCRRRELSANLMSLFYT